MYPILRLPRVASNSRNDEPRINKIATAFSKPRNDDVRAVIARSATTKQSINHCLFIHSRKNKRIHYYLPLRHCEGQRPVAIHKPQKVNTKTEKKKEIAIIYQIKELIFNFQF